MKIEWTTVLTNSPSLLDTQVRLKAELLRMIQEIAQLDYPTNLSDYWMSFVFRCVARRAARFHTYRTIVYTKNRRRDDDHPRTF